MILCLLSHYPDMNGYGASQRVWYLVNSLTRLGPVHVVVLQQAAMACPDAPRRELDGSLQSFTILPIPEWRRAKPAAFPVLRSLAPGWRDLLAYRSFAAPRFSRGTLSHLAAKLPANAVDLIFANRLTAASLASDMLDRGLVAARRKVVDFDDLPWKTALRELAAHRDHLGAQGRLLARIETGFIRRAEKRIAETWDAVSLCSDTDVAELRGSFPTASVFSVPNVVERPLLPVRAADGRTNLLFVGHLSYEPNVHGLAWFMTEAWPRLRAIMGEAVHLDIVGMHPCDRVKTLAETAGVSLHANVPSVEPFYANADIAIAPILHGGGTRIKIIEAMAYGRPVVSTPLGVEGLEVADGDQVLIEETGERFAAAVAGLAQDRAKQAALIASGLRLHRSTYGSEAMVEAVRTMSQVAVRK